MPRRIPATIVIEVNPSGRRFVDSLVESEEHRRKIVVFDVASGSESSSQTQAKEPREGCLVCTVEGLDHLPSGMVGVLCSQGRAFDAVVIRVLSRAAATVAGETIIGDEHISQVCFPNSIILDLDVANALSFLRPLEQGQSSESYEARATAAELVLVADRVVVTDTSQLFCDGRDSESTKKDLKGIEAVVWQHNPVARVLVFQRDSHCSRAHVDAFLGVQASSLECIDPRWTMMDRTDANGSDDSALPQCCVLEVPDFVSNYRFSEFMSFVMSECTGLLRAMGVLFVRGVEERRYVVHAISCEWCGALTTVCDNVKRASRMVFVGYHLNVEELRVRFYSCTAEEHLRFCVGCCVCANTGEWVTGRVVKHWDEGHAYRIALDDGSEVWAPVDEDDFVQQAF